MKDSVDHIWEEYYTPLKLFIKKHINNEQDIEDLLQTIFLKIYSNINRLDDANKIGPWIYSIARNTIYDFYRAQRHDLNIDVLSEDLYIEQHEDETCNYEISKCMARMIQFLPDIYKQAIILTEYMNYTQRDLANHLGLSESGAKSRVQRARRRLKEMMLDCCSIEHDFQGNILDYKPRDKNSKYCCERT